MNDFRCTQCNRLLAKVSAEAQVEIKCPRCKTMNAYSKQIYITIEERENTACIDPETAEN